ncbi:hypothetical protein PR048_027601 [Dryococelus australis]|uniref:Uncharacterized protein n=1 Tax=Dryococelus australis TaxID=614101 RepID=A0ABQ9GGY9_9NEOP|nr:hypothetical protein PR048_027601 [Dryococelus australis]
MNPRLAPKLTKKCSELPPFSPIKVRLAAREFNHSVSTEIMTHKIDSLFDCFNSSSLSSAKVYRSGFKKKSRHWNFLDEYVDFFRKMKFLNTNCKNPPCIQGWLENIAALKILWRDLQQKYNFSFLLTRHLSQDCIGNLFSVIMFKGGNNTISDAAMFRTISRSVTTNQLLKPSEDSNCEKINLSVTPKQFAGNIDESAAFEKETDLAIVNMHSKSYATGWVISRLKHDSCKEKLSTLNAGLLDPHNVYIYSKQYDGTNLLYPNQVAADLCDGVVKYYAMFLKKYLQDSKEGVKHKLLQKVCRQPATDSNMR